MEKPGEDPNQVKVRMDPQKKRRLVAVLRRQGITNNSEGINRLIDTLLAHEDLQPLLLNQVHGPNKKDLARAILRRMAK